MADTEPNYVDSSLGKIADVFGLIVDMTLGFAGFLLVTTLVLGFWSLVVWCVWEAVANVA